MTERLAKRIGDYLVSDGIVMPDNAEVVTYGLYLIIAGVMQIVLLLVVGILLGLTAQIALYSLFWAMLKRFIGGAHADRHWSCLLSFTVMAVAAAVTTTQIPTHIAVASAPVMSCAAVVLVLLRAPVVHPNNPKPIHKLKRFRRLGVAISACQLAIVTVAALLLPEYAEYIVSVALGGLSASITLLLPTRNERGKMKP